MSEILSEGGAARAVDQMKGLGLRHAMLDDLFKAKAGQEEEFAKIKAECDPYLAEFAPPQRECICCGATLGGDDPIGAFLGTFRWGLVNGEGRCGRCGWPARAYHKFGPFESVTLILQYHPNGFEQRPVQGSPDE